MFSDLVTDEILLGIAIGLVFDEVGRKLVLSRVRTILGAEECADVDDDSDSRDDTATRGDSTSAHTDTADYFDPTVAGGADKVRTQ
ncbi:hypothetical protein BN903_38 [Halorubrum sp. AJ67]|nr:hypothetical protein BN903_38 [Halorubrum sp. AJ67]